MSTPAQNAEPSAVTPLTSSITTAEPRVSRPPEAHNLEIPPGYLYLKDKILKAERHYNMPEPPMAFYKTNVPVLKYMCEARGLAPIGQRREMAERLIVYVGTGLLK